AEDGIRDDLVTGVQTCALPISGIAGADDPIDGCKTLVREPEGERTDRLGATGDEQRVYVEDPRGAEQDRVDPSVRVRRRGDDDRSEERRVGKGGREWGWASEGK